MEGGDSPEGVVQSKHYTALRSDLSAALSAFDRAQDWADLIHDLQRVNRVFAKHAHTSYLPEKQLLAKRLAQCLTSSLPSGVHLKALETYRIVFTRIGPTRLARDLPIYAGGLFPLFSYSATSLKPALLTLFETQFLPLGPSLAPLLDGLVLAILPGLEDESSEFYDRSLKLLDALAASLTHPRAFSRALWRALLLSPPARLPAANYIRIRLPISSSTTPWSACLLSDMPLVSHAMAAALADRNALVQRSVLDLLLGELALDLPFFKVEAADCTAAAVALVGGVFGALLRRDLSLTKRVHSWFLGGKTGDLAIKYCNDYSKRWLLGAIDVETDRSLRACARLASGAGAELAPSGLSSGVGASTGASGATSASVSAATRPCKIIAGLLDREEINASISPDLAIRILIYARSMLKAPQAYTYEREVQHAVVEVVAQMGSATIFGEMERFVVERTSAEVGEQDKYELLSFALHFAPVQEAEVRRKQLPGLLRVAVGALDRVPDQPQVLRSAVSFCGAAMEAMEFSSIRGEEATAAAAWDIMSSIASAFISFFMAWLSTAVRSAPLGIRRAYSDISVEEEISAEFETASMRDENDECATVARAACLFLTNLVASRVCGPETTTSAMQAAAKCALAGDMRVALAGARACAEIAANSNSAETKCNVEEQTSGVVRKTWRLLHPSLPTATASNAQVWLLLQRQFPEQVSVVIADGMLSPIPARRLRNLERFACVWRLAVEHRLNPVPADAGLFLMLDALDDRDWGPKMLARSWLSDALATDAGAVLDAPLRLLLTPETCSRGASHEFAGVYDAPRALYAFQVLRSIVESAMLGAGGASSDDQSDTRDNMPRGRGMGGRGSQSRLSNGGMMSPKAGRSGAHALSSATPSARTLAALAAVLGQKIGGNEAGKVTVEEGPVSLSGLLPALDYLTVLAVVSLGFLRGRVPDRFSALEKHPMYSILHSETAPQGNGEKSNTVLTNDESSFGDEVEWLAAGLGFKPYSELHSCVSVAAAEFLAKLMSCLPPQSRMCGVLAEQIAEPLLSLLIKSVKERDSVLQLHYLEAVEAIVVAEGHGFPLPGAVKWNSFGFEGTAQQLEASGSLTAIPPGGSLSISQLRVRQQEAGYIETHPLFLPWMLCGLSQACKAPADGRDVGSQEVLSLRRKWIRFVAAMTKHVGASLPMVTEGSVLTLCKLLEDRHVQCKCEESGENSISPNESEFSRIDERLLLLKALTLISATCSASFEYALSRQILCDESGLPNAVDPGGIAGGVQILSTGTHLSSSGSVPPRMVMNGNPGWSGGTGGNSTVTAYSDPSKPLSAASTAASAATLSMMNAINSPFRMFNDFVKDVFTGATSDGLSHLSDPRRSAARALHMHLPPLLRAVAQAWGPPKEAVKIGDLRASSTEQAPRNQASSRLSRELPRERRQAQRDAVLSVVEPLFASRPTDVVASLVTLFCGPAPGSADGSGSVQSMAVDMLHAVDLATPDVVVSCASEILDLAMKWDQKSVLAQDGKAQMERRTAFVNAVSALVDSGPEGGGLDSITALIKGQGLSAMRSIFAGGKSTEEHGVTAIAQAIGSHLALPRPYPVSLFHAGDFFASYMASDVETAVLRFLELYFKSCRDGDDVQGSWPALLLLAKEVQSGHRRKASITSLACVLAAFAGRHAVPHPDRIYRRELMTVSSAVLSTCSALANGTADLSSEIPAGASSRDMRSQYSARALEALATSVSILIDSSFVDDKAQITATAAAALAPAIVTLRRTAGKASAAKQAEALKQPSLSPSPRSGMDSKDGHLRQRNAVEDLDERSALAATYIMSHLAKREWGTKLVRRELVGLLDDPNFFFGKHGEILSRLASVVSEVISSGGAASLLSSIGSTAPVTATGIPGLFTGRDSESVLRARAVRRVAFCVFVAEPDHYHQQLPSVLERLRDSLRLAEPGLVVECLLCLRVLLLRTGPASIAAFRATTLSEMFRIASEPAKNLSETLATLQFLDLITLLSPPDFGYVRCFFFSSEDEEAVKKDDDGDTLPVYRPLVPQLAALRSATETGTSYPLRLEAGRTVFSGRMADSLSGDFIGQYAALLAERNRSPAMANAAPDFHNIRGELEMEFVQ